MIRVHPSSAKKRIYDVAIDAYNRGMHVAQDRRGNIGLKEGRKPGQYEVARMLRNMRLQRYCRVTLFTPPDSAA